ncbi:MAG: nucleotide sugar dehydrogenase, partial [Myxococcales bacterium]|nr:nucleotide sugar dehydrogenase [Myxococcales bacterium]
MGFEYDVCIIGTGRVGLPLGLSFMDVGLKATGVDVDPALREAVCGGQMPFHEPGYDELVARGTFQIHGSPEICARSKAVVVTVGTPLHTHIETDLRQIQSVLEGLAPHLRPGQLLCLRSTVAPGTTTFVRKWIERHTDLRVGDTLGLAFCPERIAEG